MKIVVTQPLNLYPDHIERLKGLGDVTFYDTVAKDTDEWLERTKGQDVVCTGKFGLRDRWSDLKNVFVSLPFVGSGFINVNIAKKNNATFSRSPGCNRHAVSEWIIGMMIMIFRELDVYTNIESLPEKKFPDPTIGLAFKNVTVLGKGNIGSRVGKTCESLAMNVTYLLRGDNIFETVKNADVVIDTLSSNPTTMGLLDRKFFQSLKNGAVFISVTGEEIVDIDAMIDALDSGKLAFVAHDSGGVQVGDTSDPFYRKLQKHKKVYATPHISYNSDVTHRLGNDIMIDNVEAWINGKPQNLLS